MYFSNFLHYTEVFWRCPKKITCNYSTRLLSLFWWLIKSLSRCKSVCNEVLFFTAMLRNYNCFYFHSIAVNIRLPRPINFSLTFQFTTRVVIFESFLRFHWRRIYFSGVRNSGNIKAEWRAGHYHRKTFRRREKKAIDSFGTCKQSTSHIFRRAHNVSVQIYHYIIQFSCEYQFI